MNTGKASDGDHQKPAWRENNRALVGGFINREKPAYPHGLKPGGLRRVLSRSDFLGLDVTPDTAIATPLFIIMGGFHSINWKYRP